MLFHKITVLNVIIKIISFSKLDNKKNGLKSAFRGLNYLILIRNKPAGFTASLIIRKVSEMLSF